MTPSRKRADILLVERGLFESRARAQAAIEAGLVIANGKVVAKASETVPVAAVVFAVDVGRDQLHQSLHGHSRIVSMEQTDIRAYDGKRLPQRPDVVVI